MNSRHAIVALTLPPLLGAGLVFNLAAERWAMAGAIAVILVAFAGVEVALWEVRDRRRRHARRAFEEMASAPLHHHAPHARDYFYEDLERRRWAG